MWPLAIRMLTVAVAQFLVVHAFALAEALGWISEIAGLRRRQPPSADRPSDAAHVRQQPRGDTSLRIR